MTTSALAHSGADRLDDPSPRQPPSHALVGLRHVVRLVVRRDRWRLVWWTTGIVGLVAATGSSITGLYDTQAELDQYGQLMQDNAALIVQAGPGYGLETATTGAVMMNEVGIWTIVAISLMNLFLIVRHTRTEEEVERAELVRAAPVGRYTTTSAAMLGATLANLVVSAGVVATLLVFDLPLTGSLAFGAALLGVGSTFAGISAVMAQIAGSSRAALAMGGLVLATSFVTRAVGDVGSGHLSWLSPIGWAQAIRAFADERWWVLLLPAAATTALVALAFFLQAHRDDGAGIIAPRAGRSGAAAYLSTPLALAFRLQRAAILGWTVGLGLMSMFYGIVADQAERIIDENPDMEDFFAQLGDASVTDVYLSTSMLILALITCGFMISSVLRLRSEEVATRADPILATPISRSAWATGHLVVGAVGTTILLGVSGAAVGGGFAAVTGDLSHVPTMFAAGLAMVPAVWVLGGITMLLFGLRPAWALAGWLALVAVLVVGLFGNLLDLPMWSQNLSPFQHVPAMPAESFTPVPIILLVGVAVAATTVGIVTLGRRDMS